MCADGYKNLALSSAQLGVWRELHLKPRDTSYSIWDFVELSGNINYSWLLQAISHVCEASPNLRLTFSGGLSDPLQHEQARNCVHVPFVDFSDEEDPQRAALDWMTHDHSKAFDVHGHSLFRNAVLRLSADHLYWYRNYHHLIVDGYSTMLLGEWTASAYRTLAASSGDQRSLSLRSYASYVRYLEYEAAYRQSAQFELDREFWSSSFRWDATPVSLSVRSRGATDGQPPIVSNEWLSSEVSAALNRWSRSLGVSVSHLVIAIIAIYMHRASGEVNIPIGLPTHGRESPSMFKMAGMCANVMNLNFSVDSKLSVAQTIRNISALIGQASRHRQYRRENPRRDPVERNPFRVHANVVRGTGAWLFNDKAVRGVSGCAGPVEDLMFLVVEGIREKRYRICVLGNPQLYESWEVQSHQRYFSDLLINIGGASEKPLHEISIVSNCCPSITQYHRLTREHMEAQVPECFHYLIQLQSVKTPAAVAILENHREISYLTLNQQSNRFANFLKDRGVGRGDIVGLCVDRSVDMLVSLLGILKVGAAYLPLDAELPPTRLAFMVADAKAKLIVTQTAYELQMPDHLASLVFVDAPDHGWEEWPTTAPLSAVSGSDLAYVIYTSGSTGEPKGVLVEHRSVCNLLGAQREFVSPGLGARVLQFASLSFDVSVSEIGMALAGGATLVMADKRALSLENLTATLREKKIEVLSLSPSALSAISCENLPWLRTLIVAGEACPVSLAQLWSPARRFINAYGPTEATVYATYHEYRGGSSLPIGRPLANVDVYILDEHQKLAAIGVGGELHIGGVGVARGYLNRPELSSRQFVTNPFSEGAGQMYRTGDLARWLPDGSIEFLGRKDQQVKIRGFRIELGEVEVALAALADVRECTVVDYQVGSRKQLVAYLVPRTLARRSSRELRRDLRQQLPDYMIPSIIAYLEALPRTLSGKIDRRALPTPNEMFLKRAYVRPVTDTQIAMATIWSQALDLDRVGRTDNFLDSGGDSIAVINVLAAAEKTFGVSLPVHALYEAETLEDLAAEIDRLLTA